MRDGRNHGWVLGVLLALCLNEVLMNLLPVSRNNKFVILKNNDITTEEFIYSDET